MSDDVLASDPRHRVAAFVASTHADLDALADVSLWSMTPQETAPTLLALTRLKARIAELELGVVAHAVTVEVGLAQGATSTSNWWAHQTKMTRPEAHRLTTLACRLGDARQPVRAALAAGEVLADQAAVIVEAVDALPADLADAAVVAQAEAVLLEYAAEHDARALRVLGRRILDVVAPEVGEAHEARLLAGEEAEARAAASFRMVDDGHGQCHGRFSVPSLHGAMLQKHLMALAARRHQVAAAAAAAAAEPAATRDLPTRHRLGQAFCDYIETRREDTVPHAGGVPATIVVTMSLDSLLGGLAAASLDTGGRISAGEARRLACQAGIIPAVLGGKSQVLDLGRKRRFHTEPQRIALALRDGGCTAEGCDRPPGMCHAHHDRPWHQGGHTDVKTGRLLCPRHHTLTHDPRYTTNPTAHGKLRFITRT
ncbi:MAG: DUF222 domain-containing protein [Nocardioides sp.]